MKFCFRKKDFIETETTPEKLAVVGEFEELSWSEFQTRIDSFCEFLISNKLTDLENPVVVFGHKEVEMVIAIYACMKLNLCYIPIDVIYPEERIKTVLKVAKVDLIINCSDLNLDFTACNRIDFRSNNSLFISNSTLEKRKILPLDPLVYIIFTSGSTGEPKGVQISTEAVVSFTDWMCSSFGFTSEDVFVNIALFSFDLSVYELLSFSALGSTLILNPKSITENPDLMLERVGMYQGTIWVSTPSYSFIYSRVDEPKIANHLKYFLFCGEMLPNTLAKNLKNNFPQTKIYNTYGPTEATVATTLVEITEEIIEKYNPLPVGVPKPESKIVLIDEEIVIVGKNVSVGYLNRPDLNEEKFSIIDNQRAFKTGDNGYFQDGMLFCKGRNDDQVKLHGYRIELNEISAKLEEIPRVVKAETIALRRNDEVKKIVSLVELKTGNESTTSSMLKAILGENLPEYMIPADIKIIEKIPLNQNGKADKKLLQEIYLKK